MLASVFSVGSMVILGADMDATVSSGVWGHVFSLWGMIIIVTICSTLGTIVGVIAKQWRRAREAEIEAALKADLIKQGRSLEEIERLLQVTAKPYGKADDA
jgi:hypothetical protein